MSDTDSLLGRIKQTLDQLAGEISSGKYPAILLADLKGSVDQLRLSMWAVIEAEEQLKHAVAPSTMEFKKKLVEFRIKRIVQMLNEIRGDVAVPERSDLDILRAALGTTLQTVERRAAKL